jgi:hypothetical protein
MLVAALAVAALPVSAEGQSGGTTSAQTPSRPCSELVGAGYEVKGFAVLPRGISWGGSAMLQREASVYLCALRAGNARNLGDAAPAVAGSSCYLVGGAPLR